MTYTLSPDLPNGVEKDASRSVSGTPTVALASTEYTWTATDADGDPVSLTFTIAVDGIPTFGTQTISDKAWTQRQAISAFTLPNATDGDAPLTYAISPDLPNGVEVDASRRVAGTPTVALASTAYTWTATDADGDKASLTFDIAVDGIPTFGTQTIANQSWTQRQAIRPCQLDTAPANRRLHPAIKQHTREGYGDGDAAAHLHTPSARRPARRSRNQEAVR